MDDMSSSTFSCPVCSTPISPDTGICPTCATPLLAPPSDTPVTVPSAARAEAVEPWPAGSRLAKRYRIVVLLGRGGMGEVYRADDLKLGQPVALKVLPRPMEEKPERLERFLGEVRMARQISHPNVCRVYDVGEAEGRHFISMEYIDGENLAALLRRVGRLSSDKAVELAHQVCRGLAAAHQEGILHRDLKPANLMVDGRGVARITDFGLAALAKEVAGLEVGHGTPAYMAPEQRAGREVTARSDLYALGLILYQVLTGNLPAPAGEELVPPSRLAAGVDPAFERLVLACLAVEPAERPESAMALATMLPLPRQARAVTQNLAADPLAGFSPVPGRSLPGRPNWVLERRLGAGGFGEVWLAAQRKTRELRVFKFCADPKSLSALQREITLYRLLQETLGERDDIARVYDWNFDQAPYFIEAEYSAGGSLLDWASEQGGIGAVPLALRLEIVAQVAGALAAAHSVGVLHKDVKPGNVLITEEREGNVQARLSDFGVGRLTERRRLAEAGITSLGLTAATIRPASRGSAGTPLYTAPEILEGRPPTLQTDVYALGVMLYQVVVGDFSRVLAPGWDREIEDDLLREDVAAAVDGSPEHRLSSAAELAERLRSLEERRRERQEKRRAALEAERVKADLEAARRRRKRLSLLVALLLVFAVAMTVQSIRVSRAAEVARQEASSAREIAEFLEELFRSSDPNTAAGEEITVRELLDRGAERMASDPGLEPAVRARLMEVMGEIYHSLGLYDKAEGLLEESLRLRRQLFGKDHVEVAESLVALAELRRMRGRFEDSVALTREALEIQRMALGPRHVKVAASLDELGHVLWRLEDAEGAERAYREALAIYRENFGTRDVHVARSLDNVGFLMQAQGRFEVALPVLSRARDLKIEALGDESHDTVAHTMNLLVRCFLSLDRVAEAEESALGVLRIRERIYGREHVLVASAMTTLAMVREAQGNYTEAETLLREALEIELEKFGRLHSWPASVMTDLAQVLVRQGRAAEARPLVDEALAIWLEIGDADHWRASYARNVKGAILAVLGRLDEAAPLLRETYEEISRQRGADSIYTRRARRNLAILDKLRSELPAGQQEH